MATGPVIEPIIELPGCLATILLIVLIPRRRFVCVLMMMFVEVMYRVYVLNPAIPK
jgi:hypothetical protein